MEVVGGLYHVMARGNRGHPLFLDDEDREFLLAKLRRLGSRLDVKIHAFALMPNHVHFLLRRLHDPIGQFMASLLTAYARQFNRRRGFVGHVFQGRYRSILCEDETYLLRLVRYIHRNPLRAGLCTGLEFEWSSYSAYLGRTYGRIVETGPVLHRFGADPETARAAFREFHEDPDAAADTRATFMPRRGVFLGSDSVEQRMLRRAALSRDPMPAQRPCLDEILREALRASGIHVEPVEVRGPSRRFTASLARASFVEMAIERHGYRSVEVAGYLGRSPENLRMILARRRAENDRSSGRLQS